MKNYPRFAARRSRRSEEVSKARERVQPLMHSTISLQSILCCPILSFRYRVTIFEAQKDAYTAQ